MKTNMNANKHSHSALPHTHKPKTHSNYEKMKNSVNDSFLQYDQENMIRKFSLRYDSDYLYIAFIDHIYRINRHTGVIHWSDDHFQTSHNANYNEVMTIYDVLCYSKENCHLAHEFVNLSSLSTVRTGNLTANDSFFQRTADSFNQKTSALRHACKNLSGKPLPKGDVAYELQLFSFLPVILRFWEADEEFPASLQILVDKNTLDYMHYETLMFALSHLFDRIREEMQNEKR